MNKSIFRTLENILSIISVLLLLWLGLSFLEIVFKNLTNPVYSNYNLIVITFKNFDKLLYGGIF